MKKIIGYTIALLMFAASIYLPVIIYQHWDTVGTTPDIGQKLILFFISMASLLASYGYYLVACREWYKK